MKARDLRREEIAEKVRIIATLTEGEIAGWRDMVAKPYGRPLTDEEKAALLRREKQLKERKELK